MKKLIFMLGGALIAGGTIFAIQSSANSNPTLPTDTEIQALKSTKNNNMLSATMRDNMLDLFEKMKNNISSLTDEINILKNKQEKALIVADLPIYTMSDAWRDQNIKKIAGNTWLTIEGQTPQEGGPYSFCAISAFEVRDDKVQGGPCDIKRDGNVWKIRMSSTHGSEVMCRPGCFRLQ